MGVTACSSRTRTTTTSSPACCGGPWRTPTWQHDWERMPTPVCCRSTWETAISSSTSGSSPSWCPCPLRTEDVGSGGDAIPGRLLVVNRANGPDTRRPLALPHVAPEAEPEGVRRRQEVAIGSDVLEGGAMIAAAILIVLLILVVTIVVAGGLRRLVRDESEVERRLQAPETPTVSYAVPHGVDPADLRTALLRAGFSSTTS